MALRRAFAQEDTDLQTATVQTSRDKEYKDIDLTFTAKRDSGEIFKKTDAAAVKQAIKTLVMTNFLEKPFLPEYGGDVRSQLFELAYDGTDITIERNIKSNIRRYEPRAQVLEVISKSQPDYNSLEVTIKFKVVNTNEVVTFTTTLSRLR